MFKSSSKESSKSKASREELREEHVRVVQGEKELAQKYQEIKSVFQKLDDCYQNSKATFSVGRYGQLKDMIKDATSDAVMNGIKAAINSPNVQSDSGQERKGGLQGFLSKAREFSKDQTEQKSGSQDGGASKSVSKKMSSFFKKVKDVTGFSDDPVADEDVMSDSELQRDSGRKKRAIQRHVTELNKAFSRLETLKEAYQASKAHAPPKRYIELKDMIKQATADKFT